MTFKIAKMLSSLGFRTGMFVSPHISSYRERIQVDFQPVPEALLTDELTRVCDPMTTVGSLDRVV